MFEIIPSILTDDLEELQEKIRIIGESGLERVQIDIIDPAFAKNKTVDPAVISEIDTNLKLDFHLMTKEPVDWVERTVRAGAERIIGQIEMMADQIDFVGKVQGVGLEAGLAIDLETPPSQIDPVILGDLDVVLVMSVKAGFGGQEFDRRAISKIEKLDKARRGDQTPFKICVDGGVDEENIAEISQAGADEIIVGKRLFEGDLEENLRRLQNAQD